MSPKRKTLVKDTLMDNVEESTQPQGELLSPRNTSLAKISVPAPAVAQLNSLTGAQKVAMGLGGTASALGEAAKQAAFSIGFGTMGLGGVLFLGEQYGKTASTPLGLLAIGTFFVFAALGRLLDRHLNM